MAIERFKGGSAGNVYLRLRKHGRMLPDSIRYINSWVDTDFSQCFQLMECDSLSSLNDWASAWSDLIDFEFVQVRSGTEAFAIAADWESVKHLTTPATFKPRQWTRRHGGIAAEHIIQSDESWFDAAISMPGEPTRLLGGAPSREGAESIATHQLDALEHRKCTDACERVWTQAAGE